MLHSLTTYTYYKFRQMESHWKGDIPGFVWTDYAIFAVTIVISLGIGVYYALAGGRQKTTEEYLIGNRQMKILPVALSLMVSFESSIMMLGFPAEVYSYGLMFWLTIFGFMLTLTIGTKIVVPLFHPLGIKSVYEVKLITIFEKVQIDDLPDTTLNKTCRIQNFHLLLEPQAFIYI